MADFNSFAFDFNKTQSTLSINPLDNLENIEKVNIILHLISNV